MKFYDEKIQKHLLNGGKIKNVTFEGSYVIYIGDNAIIRKNNNECYVLKGQDLSSNKWEIVETEYDWDKIIKDKILCVFSNDIAFKHFSISILDVVDYKNNLFKTNESLFYNYCKPFNPEEYNVAEYIKDYEK